MNGNRVGTEGVDQQHVELAVGLGGQASAGHRPYGSAASRWQSVRYVKYCGVLRDFLHGGVDLEIGERLPGFGVGGDGPGPQAHNADVAVVEERVASSRAPNTSPTGPVR